jgi:EAL domain-containing protein (putative c-di-GMP-specific phosphodiesterase class I)
MYRAKEIGRGAYRIYEAEMSESAADRLALETDLRRAIENDEFELFYQPQVDLRTGRPIGVEALIRWNHPKRGLLAPGVFLDFAEQAGYMSDIGPWVTRTACAQMSAWLEGGLDVGRMAVNLSATEFQQYDVAQTVVTILEETGLDPSRLEIEITETTAMHSGDKVVRTLHALRDIGVRIAIDDFGTGYSSMSYLKRFPVQTLKIAQTFMHDVNADSQSAAIASMLIDLCSELKLDVVAEGVELASELEFLRVRGCFVVQGFIYSQPVPAAEVEELLSRDLVPAA